MLGRGISPPVSVVRELLYALVMLRDGREGTAMRLPVLNRSVRSAAILSSRASPV